MANNYHHTVIKLFINKLLKQHINSISNNYKHIYPILLGGISHVRCIDKLNFNMFTSDIDIKFVIDKETDLRFKNALKMREEFVMRIIQDTYITKILHDNFKAFLILGPIDTTLHGKRQAIFIKYQDVDKNIVLIDTAIASENTFPFFNHYKNFFPFENLSSMPIPYIFKNNLPFATCNWTYYDTIRMLNTSRIDYYKYKTTFFQKKYTKYIIKFIALYFVINKIKNPAKTKLYKLYTELTDNNNTTVDFTPFENILEKTNLNDLIQKYIIPPFVKFIIQQIIKFVLKQVLNKYMTKYANKSFYPLIIGGANLTRCVKNNFFKNIKDIDLPFIVSDLSKLNDAYIARNSFLKNILDDQNLKEFLYNLGKKHQLIINIVWETFNDSKGNFKDFVDRLKFNNLIIIIKDLNNNVLLNYPFLDSTIIQESSAGKNEWHGYDKYIQKSLANPIPYIINNGVFYATCDYTKFDIAKMTIIYKNEFVKAQTASILEYFLKYLIKLAFILNEFDLVKKFKQFSKKFFLLDKNAHICSPQDKHTLLTWYDELKNNTTFGKMEYHIAPLLL